MTEERLIVGLPAGSLADPNRGGNLVGLLENAGFEVRDYDKGGPSTFPLTPFLVGWDGRPQEFGAQLALGEVDVAIAGDDWVRERLLEYRFEYGQDVVLNRVLSLRRGGVRIVIIRKSDAEADGGKDWLAAVLARKPLVTMVSEMPYLALEWFQRRAAELGFGDSHSGYSIQKFKTPPRIETGIVIYETWGKTEAKVKSGSVDFGLEITQTGSAIRNYGLEMADEVMRSEAGIWITPRLKENPGKVELAHMFLLNLYGAIYAEDKVLLSFNCKKSAVPGIVAYLEEHRLFADEPTMNEGVHFTEFSVQLDARSAALPLARARYDLARLGATGIETIPLESSIPGIDAVQL